MSVVQRGPWPGSTIQRHPPVDVEHDYLLCPRCGNALYQNPEARRRVRKDTMKTLRCFLVCLTVVVLTVVVLP